MLPSAKLPGHFVSIQIGERTPLYKIFKVHHNSVSVFMLFNLEKALHIMLL